MQVTIDIKDSAFDKVMYLLKHLESDVKIIHKNKNSVLDIDIIKEEDEDYKILEKGRIQREKTPQDYLSMDSVDWN